jgi:hypothetical protein
MKILYKFPSRSRRNKMFACIDNIISMARHDDYKIQLTLDYDDKEVIGNDVKERIASYGDKVYALWGKAENKIHAVNKDMEFSGDWDILISTADDFWFETPGFDLMIIKDAIENPDCLLHYHDGHVGARLITMPIMDRAYFNRFNYIYYPGYISVYADNEQMEVAKLLGCHRYFNKHLFTHKHPANGKQYGPADELLKKTEDRVNYKIDGALFKERQKRNFDLIIS